MLCCEAEAVAKKLNELAMNFPTASTGRVLSKATAPTRTTAYLANQLLQFTAYKQSDILRSI